MFEQIKGFRTYGSLILIALLGVAVDLQASCIANPDELGAMCNVILNPFMGKAIVAMTAIAAWFRKLAGTSK